MQIFQRLLQSVRDLAGQAPVDTPNSDPENSWPETGRRLFRVPFLPQPSSVLQHLENSFVPIMAIHCTEDLGGPLPEAVQSEVERHLKFYAVGLETLLFNLPREEMSTRKEILEGFCKLQARHLAACPFLLRHGGILTYLELLTRDLAACGSVALQNSAEALRKEVNNHLFLIQRPPLESPDAPGELTREGVFVVLLDECHRDGTVDEDEAAALEGVARILDIGPERQKELFAASRARYEAKELPPGGAMEPEQLMTRLKEVAEADGIVTESEKALLEAIRYFLRVGVSTPPAQEEAE